MDASNMALSVILPLMPAIKSQEQKGKLKKSLTAGMIGAGAGLAGGFLYGMAMGKSKFGWALGGMIAAGLIAGAITYMVQK
jgi:hypothetical protein